MVCKVQMACACPTLHYTPAMSLLCSWNTPTYSPTSRPPCWLFFIPGMLFSGLFARHPPSHPLGFSLHAISSGKPSPNTTSTTINLLILPQPVPFLQSIHHNLISVVYFSALLFTA